MLTINIAWEANWESLRAILESIPGFLRKLFNASYWKPALPYLPQKFRPENHPNFKEIEQLWVAKLDLTLADLMCKKQWQHCSVLKSVDRGTGRALADLGLALRQV